MHLIQQLNTLINLLQNAQGQFKILIAEQYLEELKNICAAEFVSLYLINQQYKFEWFAGLNAGMLSFDNLIVSKLFKKKKHIICPVKTFFYDINKINENAFSLYKTKCSIYPLIFNDVNIGTLILFKENDFNERLINFVEIAAKYLSAFIFNKSISINSDSESDFDEKIIYSSSIIKKVLQKAEAAAASSANVLITGASGTGKELLANYIHKLSNRKNKPFIPVACGSLPYNLIENELFGSKKGAFTGAVSDKKGKFMTADGGTLFLDEISELSEDMQIKLLRVLQERKIFPLGSETEYKVDARIIAASNKNIEELTEQNLFRKDLFYRLNVIHIHLPSLKERKEDIPILINYFLNKYNIVYSKNVELNKNALNKLVNYEWRGNIRELQNFIERIVVLDGYNENSSEELKLYAQNNNTLEKIKFDININNDLKLEEAEHLFKKWFINVKLEQNDWNITKTAKKIGIQRTYLSKLVGLLKLK